MHMNRTITLFALFILSLALFSFKPVENKKQNKKSDEVEINGATLFNKKACNLCHHPNEVVVGPSLIDISSAYKGNEKAILDFLNGQADPIVHPEEYNYMKPVLNQLKNMKPEERQALAAYIASHK